MATTLSPTCNPTIEKTKNFIQGLALNKLVAAILLMRSNVAALPVQRSAFPTQSALQLAIAMHNIPHSAGAFPDRMATRFHNAAGKVHERLFSNYLLVT